MNLIFSIVGIIFFTILLSLVIKYVNGNWNVNEKSKATYKNWVELNGNKIKKRIIIFSIIYYILMAFQLLSYL